MQSRIFCTTALAAALALSPLAMAAAAAPAQSAPSASSAAPQAPQRRSILEELNLTAAQQASIREAMQQNFQQLRPQMQTLDQKRQAFENATPGSSGYQSAVNDLAQAEADFAKARTLREGTVRSKVYELLTPTQRTKLKDLIAEQKAQAAKMRQAAQAQGTAGNAAPPASH